MLLQSVFTIHLLISNFGQALDLSAGTWDFIIIGAGSGGSVLANRLSEIPEWKILLLEAGKEEMFLTDIPLLAPLMHITDYNWGYKTEPKSGEVSFFKYF